MSKPVSFNPKRDIPYFVAVAQAVLLSWACGGLFGLFGWVIGGVLGLLVSVTMAYAASQYVDMAKARQPYAMALMIVVGICAPIITGTAAFYAVVVPAPDWLRGIVGAAVGIAPDVCVALAGFVGGKGMVQREEAAVSVAEPKPKKKKSAEPAVITEPAPVVVPVGHWEAAHACPHCEAVGVIWSTTNRARYSGHTGKCKHNPARQFAEAAKEVR